MNELETQLVRIPNELEIEIAKTLNEFGDFLLDYEQKIEKEGLTPILPIICPYIKKMIGFEIVSYCEGIRLSGSANDGVKEFYNTINNLITKESERTKKPEVLYLQSLAKKLFYN